MIVASKRVCSIYREMGRDPNTCPKVVEEDANLALSGGGQLSPEDQLDEITSTLSLRTSYMPPPFLQVSLM